MRLTLEPGVYTIVATTAVEGMRRRYTVTVRLVEQQLVLHGPETVSPGECGRRRDAAVAGPVVWELIEAGADIAAEKEDGNRPVDLLIEETTAHAEDDYDSQLSMLGTTPQKESHPARRIERNLNESLVDEGGCRNQAFLFRPKTPTFESFHFRAVDPATYESIVQARRPPASSATSVILA